jgi:hypothetical protein
LQDLRQQRVLELSRHESAVGAVGSNFFNYYPIYLVTNAVSYVAAQLLDLLLACCSKLRASVVRPDSSALIQLIKAVVDFLANVGEAFLLCEFLFFQKAQGFTNDFGSGSIAAAADPFVDPAFKFGSE